MLPKFMLAALFCSATLPTSATLPAPYDAPPMYRITAKTLYDAGLQQGQLARARIQGWLRSHEMQTVINFTQSANGSHAFAQLKADNTATFPELVRELDGVAMGAEVSVDEIWASTMINELESLMTNGGGGRWRTEEAGHCSDIFAVAAADTKADTKASFAHGHNEDWPGPIWQYWYWVAYTPAPGADFLACAGQVYPGGLVGWASTWNGFGIFATQNSLFPTRTQAGGLSSAFAQRHAICGASSASQGLDAIVETMTSGASSTGLGWSSGASMNMISLRERRMLNVEVHESRHSVHEVDMDDAAGANYSHFNMYKHLEVGKADAPGPSTIHRQARVDSLAPTRTMDDIIARLGDRADDQYPIFRNMTLLTILLDGASGTLRAWCCHRRPADGGPPAYTWDLSNFFVAQGDV